MAVVLVLLAGCGGQAAETAQTAEPDSGTRTTGRPVPVDVVYDSLERSLRQGGVYHAVVDRVVDADGQLEEQRSELWADATRGVARQTGIGGGSGVLLADEQLWVNGASQAAPVCPGLGQVASIVLACEPPPRGSTTTAVQGRYIEAPAVALVTRRKQTVGEAIERSVIRTYLDADTHLPLGAIEEGVRNDGKTTYEFTAKTSYRARFLPADQLPEDFFDPASVDWDAPPPDDTSLDPPVYWLGQRFDAPGDLPDLVLSGITRPREALPYRAMLQYVAAADPRGPTLLTILVHSEPPTIGRTRDCPPGRAVDDGPVSIGDTAAVRFACADIDRHVIAVVSFTDTHLELDAPGRFEQGQPVSSAYGTQQALTTVIEDLRPVTAADDPPRG
jgi:hypothetical protein